MADNATGMLDNLKVTIPDLTKLPIMATEIKQIDKTAGRVIDQAPGAMFKVSIALLLIVLGWMVAGWLATRLYRLLVRTRVEETLAAFLGSSTRYTMFFTIFIIALTIVGVGSATLAALVGAIGLAVGFAVKGTLGNVAGGIMLIVHRPIKVGDWVENTTVSGTVKRIGLFSTEINTQEFIRVFIPNALLWENILKNHTYNRMRMLKLEFGIDYGMDVRKAFEIVLKALASNALVLKTPEPVLSLDHFGEHGAMCEMKIWARTEDRGALRNMVLLEVMEALRDAGIRMAYMKEPKVEAATDEAGDVGKDANSASEEVRKDGKVPSITKG